MFDVKMNEEDLNQFKDWLELDLESISWEGRFLEEFHVFWSELFLDNREIEFYFLRLELMRNKATSGPLVTWFNWLREKFICYLFLYKDFSIRDLAKVSQHDEKTIALVLRDFFIERYPHMEEKLNDCFQVGTIVSKNLYLKFEDIKESFGLNSGFRGSLEEDVLTSLEVTLYPDWRTICELLTKMNAESKVKIDSLVKKASFKKQVKFFQELALLFIFGGLLIFTVKVVNKHYEDYLIEKISLFEPNFFWLDKSLSFKSKDPLADNEVELSYKELEKLEAIESKNIFKDEGKAKRYEVESDVALTSVEALPRDFTVADLEQSEYEEVKKGGYRDSRYGRRKAYRVMMTSVNPKETKQKLLQILKFFEIKQVDNVKPGTSIPGGLYFNLYVKRNNLKEFLSRVSSVEESTILESKTVFGGPYGTNKVFIWIKNI
ncbi:MAG: hypothetical protein CME64_15735 [Halobacteriovoraceae bacterium]|nr:hypothetical protein [Halobacteriovoraceae bacterium]|tara:strand:+ start:196884 stop:198185 length:1302 start_codon:yes stop_codon:yes gene_type:complete